MKKKDLFNEIRSKALNEMPDVFNKIDLNSIVIDEPEVVKSPFNLRKAFSYTFASIFVLVTGFMIFNFGVSPLIVDNTPFDEDIELVGFETVSATSLLQSLDPVELSFTPLSYSSVQLSANIPDNIDIINSYIGLAETVIGDKSNIIYEEVESTNVNFAYGFEYRAADLAGNLIIYQGNYNYEQITTENGSIINKYSGVIRHSGNVFTFTSSTEVVNGNTVIRNRINYDQDNYVIVTNESGKKDQKFSYSIYQDGNKVSETLLTLTEKNNSLKADLVIEANDGNRFELSIQKKARNTEENYLNVDFNINNGESKGEFSVNLVQNQNTNEFQYQYQIAGDPTLVIVDRKIKNTNGKANDDDFKPKYDHGQNTTTTETSNTTTSNQTTNGSNTDNSGTGNTTNDNNNTTNNSDNGNQGTNNKGSGKRKGSIDEIDFINSI
jgi:hypothetical protein